MDLSDEVEPTTTTIALTIAAALVTVAVAIASRRLERGTAALRESMLVGAVLLGMLWIPQALRDLMFAVAVGVLVSRVYRAEDWKRISVAITSAILSVALVKLWDGGGSTLLGFTGGAFGAAFLAVGIRELKRLERAKALVPGERPTGEVDIGGRIAGGVVEAPPRYEGRLEAGAWQIEWISGERTAVPAELAIATEQGDMFVDLATIDLKVHASRTRGLPITDARRIAKALGLGDAVRPPAGVHPNDYATLRFVPPGSEVYALGIPQWRNAPGRSYRDTTLIPVFRHGELYDSPELEVAQRAKWGFVRAAGWGVMALAISLAQFAGWAR